MKVRTEVSSAKLRGGFYSPEGLVDLCVERVLALNGRPGPLNILEPSAGEGAFLRGIKRSALANRIQSITAIELVAEDVEKSRRTLEETGLAGTVAHGSFIRWLLSSGVGQTFDAAVGNPPFLRYQFVEDQDAQDVFALAAQLGWPFAGVSNLWIPVLIGALDRLRVGGAFAFIIPTEFLTGISAGAARLWLTARTDDLSVDLFPPGSFPDVLQEVLILSGVRRQTDRLGGAAVTFREHCGSRCREWIHAIPHDTDPWTRYLLSPDLLRSITEVAQLPAITRLAAIARFQVAAVTGANEYFSVARSTVDQFDLHDWAVPLLPRLRHSTGLRYTASDHVLTLNSDARSYLLDFSAAKPDPTLLARPRKYLDIGENLGIPNRYKCRIRRPWFRVPHIHVAPLMLSKRSHRFPRMIVNEAGVVTTDTVYRGTLLPKFAGRKADLVAAFHNSVSLLSVEMEGRTFGGGVLELVPTEIGRIQVPFLTKFGQHLDTLDKLARSSGDGDAGGEHLVEATDSLLLKADVGISPALISAIRQARETLMGRRIERNSPAQAVTG